MNPVLHAHRREIDTICRDFHGVMDLRRVSKYIEKYCGTFSGEELKLLHSHPYYSLRHNRTKMSGSEGSYEKWLEIKI